jgi:hypothetical protein
MRALIGCHDWSGSPLEPPVTRSPALRASVNLILDSRFAMCMAWGAEHGMSYHDVYSSSATSGLLIRLLEQAVKG